MVSEFKNAMLTSGIVCREDIIADGQIHRFSNHGKGKKDGWYVYHDMAGAFGDWSQNIQGKWSLKAENLPSQDKEHLVEQIEKAKQEADAERLRKHEETATFALEKWNTLSATGNSPYLLKKKVGAFGVRCSNDVLVIPLKDAAGKLWSLQWIKPDGTKRFLTGGRKKGCFHHMGILEDGKPIIVAEGYATGASVYMATQHATVVAFDAGNLEPVVAELKRAYPKSPLLIAGDDDAGREKNVGRTMAEQAAQKYGCSIVFPTFKNLNTNPTDFNDLHVLEGLTAVKEQLSQAIQSVEWPEPTPINAIKNALPPVVPLPPGLIPEPYRAWLVDIAERMQCPLDYVAVGSLIVTASIIGAGCSIRPKAKDSWTVIPNLWGGIIGAPSTLKSPALKEILKPIEFLEKEAFEVYEKDQKNYFVEGEAYKVIKEVIKKEMTKAASDADEISMRAAKEKLRTLQEPQEPHCKRYYTNDVTIEKMHELLSKNDRGLLLFRDELMGLLSTWDKAGHEADRSFYLEAWNGYGSKTTDRIGRGTINTKNLCISILGSTQPSKLLSYFQHALSGTENDGLLQRFQLLVYPDESKNWILIDRRPDDQAQERASALMIKLATLDFCHAGAYLDEKSEIPYFHFDHEAQAIFYEWLTELEGKLRDSADEPIINEHLAKYRKLMPSLALIFHLIDLASNRSAGAVTIDCVERAAGWCDYLESHARRIYGSGINPAYQAARSLARKIQDGELRDHIDTREIYRKQWSTLKTKEEVEVACHLLIDAGWLREGTLSEGRKTKKCYFINPTIKPRTHHE
jgi:putative DNA primase/helicase